MSYFKNNLCNIVVFNKDEDKILFAEIENGKYSLVCGNIRSEEDFYTGAYRILGDYGGITINDIAIKDFMEIRHFIEKTDAMCFVGKLNKEVPAIEEHTMLRWLDADSDFSGNNFMGNGIVNTLISDIKNNNCLSSIKDTEWESHDGTRYGTTYSLIDAYKNSPGSILMLLTDGEEIIDNIFRLCPDDTSKLRIKYADFIRAVNTKKPHTTSERIYKAALHDVDVLLIEKFFVNDIDKDHKALKKYLKKYGKNPNFRLIITAITGDDIQKMATKNIGGYYKIFSPVSKDNK